MGKIQVLQLRRVIIRVNKIGRNDPCPCGSGQKYKKCCAAKDEQFELRRRDERQAVQAALSWLTAKYPEETAQAMYEGFFGEVTEEEDEFLDDLPPGLLRMININSGEWMLADGHLFIDGNLRRVVDLVLGQGGPPLPVHGREWLKALGERPMSLYEVREAKPGDGLQVADLLDAAAEPVWVCERSASQSLVIWDVFGARLAWQDDAWVFSGAIYPFSRNDGIKCRDEILDIIRFKKLCDEDMRMLVSNSIIDDWLLSLLDNYDKPLPELVDASTGDKLLLTTDRYKVTDWEKFEHIMEAQDDVDGNRDDGWNRFAELGDGRCRSLASLTLKKLNTLKVFCRTPKLADEARKWLEDIAGSVINYKIREVVDPCSEKAREASKPRSEPDIPKDVQRQIIHQHLRKHYETWIDIPLPALEGKTPRAAIKSKRLHPKVIELLKSIDQLEARRIKQTGGDPLDVSFLWEQLGIER